MKNFKFRYYPYPLFILGILFLCSSCDKGSSSDDVDDDCCPPPTSFDLTLQHVTLEVSDLSASVAFYIDQLGISEIETDFLPDNEMYLHLGPRLELHLIENPDVVDTQGGLYHFAMTVPNLDDFLVHLEEKEISYGSLAGIGNGSVTVTGDGVRHYYFQDPDGYWLEINDFTETSEIMLQHLGYTVSDMSIIQNFYQGLLKIQEINTPWLAENIKFLKVGNYQEFHIGAAANSLAVANPNNHSHFALSTDNLDAFLAYLKEEGVAYGSLGGEVQNSVEVRPDGVRQTYFQDPDGYWIKVMDYED